MKTQYTPGPWQIDPDSDLLISNADLYAVGDTIARAATKADARRIVACVNACEGFSTESLESPFSVVRRASIIAQQRDELLEALEYLSSHTDPHVRMVCRAAIAKATGGA